MTDQEITRLCAQAMFDALEWEQRLFEYAPLTDDAQAMQMVKQLKLYVAPDQNGWDVGPENTDGKAVKNQNLNRAICECVAQMQAAK